MRSLQWTPETFFRIFLAKQLSGNKLTPIFGFNIIFYGNYSSQHDFSSVGSAGVWVTGRWSLSAWHLTCSLLLQLKEDMKRQKEAACFKARPNTVMYQEPFVPKKEHKMLSGRIASTCYVGLADSSQLMQLSDVFSGCCLFFISTANNALHLIN